MAKAKKGHQKVELQAQERTIVGHKVKQVRAEGNVPAVLYGKGQESLTIQVSVKDFDRALKEAGESTLVYVTVADKVYPTIIHDVARHPISGLPIHADFYKVRLDEKIKTSVPVVFTGVSPAVKDLAGIFVRNVNELEVEALPTNLPHEIVIDISKLENFGDQILLKDVKINDAVLTGNEDEIIATVQAPKSEEELAAELAAPTTDISAVKDVEKPVEEEVVEEGEVAPAATPAPAETPAKE